ncbi:MAG: glycosyltransferase [Bacteroidota bacterium]
MKLLVLASRFPYPLEKGDKLRLYYQLREFSRQHEVILVALHEHDITTEDRAAIERFCSRVHLLRLNTSVSVFKAAMGWIGGRPLQVGYFWRRKIQIQITRIIQQEAPDQIFCQLIRMGDYIRKQSLPTHLDYMDCFSLGFRRRAAAAPFWQKWIWRREARLLKQFEQAIYRDMDQCYIISDQDRAALGPPEKHDIFVSPNGLDLEKFRPLPHVKEKAEICFVGNMGYFPNVQAARYLIEQVMPLVWEKSPSVRVILAGARPTPIVQKLGHHPQVTVTGWVEDIRQPYQEGQIFVAPLFTGSGQQNKILEAMALGRPCLTTPLVNKAIGASADAIALAEDADGFAQQILSLLADAEQREKMGKAGQTFVQSQVSWSEAVKPILEGFQAKYVSQRTTNVS